MAFILIIAFSISDYIVELRPPIYINHKIIF